MQISSYFQVIIIIHFLKFIVFAVNECENICITGVNRWAGHANANFRLSLERLKVAHILEYDNLNDG